MLERLKQLGAGIAEASQSSLSLSMWICLWSLQYGGIRVFGLPICQLRAPKRQRHTEKGRGGKGERERASESKHTHMCQVEAILPFLT